MTNKLPSYMTAAGRYVPPYWKVPRTGKIFAGNPAFEKDYIAAGYVRSSEKAYIEQKWPNVARKNPRPFGKRKATHQAFKPKKKAAPKFGKRKARVVKVAALKNPLVPHHVIRGYHRLTGKAYYFNGRGFTDKKSEAAFYTEGKAAEKIMDEIEDRAPKALGPLDVHHFFKAEKRDH